ncbi:MAG TPA: hypothetical protein VHT92_06045 [Candidatus Cybelea sp.]|nr:hypothetical protein [Candidatus Cybelea sp.]
MNRRCASIALLALALPVSAPYRAQADPIATPSPRPTPSDPCGGSTRLLATANRPTVGFSACAVAKGTAAFELGYQNQVNGTPDGGSVQSQVPQNFLRVGIVSRFELDVIGPNYIATRTYQPNVPSMVTHGVADSGLGFKYELPPSGKWIVAFDGLYTGPNGSPFLTAASATLTGNLDAAYALSNSAGIGTTIAVSSTGGFENGERIQYGLVEPSVVLTKQTPDKFQFYAEYVFVSKVAPDAGGRAFTDFGVQKLLGTNVEVDVEYGHAFTGDPALRFNYIGSGLVLQLW